MCVCVLFVLKISLVDNPIQVRAETGFTSLLSCMLNSVGILVLLPHVHIYKNIVYVFAVFDADSYL